MSYCSHSDVSPAHPYGEAFAIECADWTGRCSRCGAAFGLRKSHYVGDERNAGIGHVRELPGARSLRNHAA